MRVREGFLHTLSASTSCACLRRASSGVLVASPRTPPSAPPPWPHPSRLLPRLSPSGRPRAALASPPNGPAAVKGLPNPSVPWSRPSAPPRRGGGVAAARCAAGCAGGWGRTVVGGCGAARWAGTEAGMLQACAAGALAGGTLRCRGAPTAPSQSCRRGMRACEPVGKQGAGRAGGAVQREAGAEGAHWRRVPEALLCALQQAGALLQRLGLLRAARARLAVRLPLQATRGVSAPLLITSIATHMGLCTFSSWRGFVPHRARGEG